MREFSQILKELRNKKGISQEALGGVLHVSRSAIAKYENGLGLPSEEVVDLMCKYFEVDKDTLFPKENIEQLITEKNIVINRQKKKNLIITVSLLITIIILFIVITSFLVKKDKRYVLDDIKTSIDIQNIDIWQDMELLLKYEGGYIYQTIEISTIEFTTSSNLYLIRVQNTYTNGYMASLTNQKGFKESEFTEKVYLEIDFPTINNNFYPIVSWHQKHSDSFTFNSQLASNEEILIKEKMNLFDGATINRYSDKLWFSYDSSITEWLLDYEYNEILRKCTIVNNTNNSSWEYEMLNDWSKKSSFTIYSAYLLEAKPNQAIDFEINTMMHNTNMWVEQKQYIKLYT